MYRSGSQLTKSGSKPVLALKSPFKRMLPTVEKYISNLLFK